MNISVGPAGKIGDGVNAYHVYKITTTDAQTDEPFQVERRYSDFLWLHNQLAKQCAGYIIPPLPAKVVGILQGPAFLERRRAGLERFLQKVIEHEELKNSTHFKHFLECSAVELTAVKSKVAFERSDSLPPPLTFAAVVQKTQTINSWWGKAYQRIAENNQVKLLAAKAGKEIPHSHTIEDPEFQKLIDYVSDLTAHVKTLQSKVKHAREQTKLTAGAYCDVIETVSAMADMDEAQEEMPTSDYSAILELLDTRARQIDAEMDAFSYGVDDFARWLRAVERAIHVREDRRFHYQAKLAAHARATAAAAAAASKSSSGGDADNQDESEPLSSSSSFSVSHNLTQDVKEGKEEFEKIHTRVMSEIARFRAEKTIELRRMFAEFAALQIRSSAELSAVIASSTKTLDEPLPPKMTRYISQSSMSMSASFSSEGDDNQVNDLKDAIMKMKARTQSSDNQTAKQPAAVDPIAAPYSDVLL